MEKSGFFNSVSGDRKYSAEDFADYFSTLIGNGVFPIPSTGLQVSSNNNMTVNIYPGKGWINGYIYSNTANLTLNISTADPILNRIDRVVLRFSTNGRAINAAIKTGAPASSPVAPTLERDSDYYELGLADIYVSAGTTVISSSNITDLRSNSSICGWVNSLVEQNTIAIFNQYMVQVNSIASTQTSQGNRITNLENQLIPPNNVTSFSIDKPINGTCQLFWNDPDDTVLGDNTIVKWAGTKIIRKAGSAPVDENDGTLVLDSKTRDAFQSIPLVQTGLTVGQTYYYRAFTYSTSGAINRNIPAISATITAQNPVSFTASGFFVVPAGVNSIDLFLVGGGGSGRSSYSTTGAGAGGGYTKTYKAASTGYKDGGAISVSPGDLWTVVVGSGGSVGGFLNNWSDGGNTSFTKGGISYVAGGGKCPPSSGHGGDGGSGGTGGFQGITPGGTDGSNGSANGGTAGIGQGHTTREWGETTGTLYSNGGSMNNTGNDMPNQPSNTGNGGDGNAANNRLAGNGGSGIVKVRW